MKNISEDLITNIRDMKNSIMELTDDIGDHDIIKLTTWVKTLDNRQQVLAKHIISSGLWWIDNIGTVHWCMPSTKTIIDNLFEIKFRDDIIIDSDISDDTDISNDTLDRIFIIKKTILIDDINDNIIGKAIWLDDTNDMILTDINDNIVIWLKDVDNKDLNVILSNN